MQETDWSLVISGMAVAVSIISLLISWKVFDRDRSILRFFPEFLLESQAGTAIKLVIVNFGRRIIIIKDAILHCRSGETIRAPNFSNDFPHLSLEEAEDLDLYFPISEQLVNRTGAPFQIRHIEIIDTLGSRYIFPSWTPRSRYRHWILKRHISKGRILLLTENE